MGWLKAIGAIFGVLGTVLNWIKESTSQKKKNEKEALKQVKEGFDNNDTSNITAGFDGLNNSK